MCKIIHYIDFWFKRFDHTSISAGHSCIKLSDYGNNHKIHTWETLTKVYRLLHIFIAIWNSLSHSVLLIHSYLPLDNHQKLIRFEVWKFAIGVPQFNLVTFMFSFLNFSKFMKIYSTVYIPKQIHASCNLINSKFVCVPCIVKLLNVCDSGVKPKQILLWTLSTATSSFLKLDVFIS